jgi:hypothetical protein
MTMLGCVWLIFTSRLYPGVPNALVAVLSVISLKVTFRAQCRACGARLHQTLRGWG